MKQEKTAGIVCDNYKLPLFRKRLKEAGFVFGEAPFTHDTTTLKVKYTQDRFEELSKLVKTAELESKRSN